MAKPLHVAILSILILAILGIIIYPFLNDLMQPAPSIKILTNDTAGIGFVDIVIKSNKPLKEAIVRVGDRRATLISSEGKNYTYRYFVSPYEQRDPIGTTKVSVQATDVDGEHINASTDMNISYFAIGEVIGGVIYYYPATPPTKEHPLVNYTKPHTLVGNILSKRNISFFSELDEGKSKRNSKIIVASHPLIVNLTALGLNVSYYAVEVRDGEWVNCLDSNGAPVPVSECKYKAYHTPSIVLKLPVYPTTQVLLTNTTIEMQPALGSTKEAVDSFLSLLAPRWAIQTNSSAH